MEERCGNADSPARPLDAGAQAPYRTTLKGHRNLTTIFGHVELGPYCAHGHADRQ